MLDLAQLVYMAMAAAKVFIYALLTSMTYRCSSFFTHLRLLQLSLRLTATCQPFFMYN